MTTLNEMIRDLERNFIGYDRLLNVFNTTNTLNQGTGFKGAVSNFPPYNIKRIGDTTYVIEMAVAGFGKQDIQIDLEGDQLKITGNAKTDKDADYLFQGLAARNFTRYFTLNDQVVVNNASLINGILKIALERIVPEAKKPRTINISDEADTVSEYAQHNPQLLTETDHAKANGKLM